VTVLAGDLKKTEPGKVKEVRPRVVVCDGRVVWEG